MKGTITVLKHNARRRPFRGLGSFLTALMACMSLAVPDLCAQDDARVVTGFVYSETDPAGLPGVTVSIKGTSKGTTTDADGNFSIRVTPSENTLVFTYVGFGMQEVQIGNSDHLRIPLQEEISALDEIVIVGYGAQKKANLTGAVETARFDEAVNQPVTNSAQLMYGRFSGVQLTQSNGLPGSDASSIIIRGVGTFGSADPLIVIDNIQYESMREFNNLSPSDIETITVLKDASASAIYGARGANGVIVVTTKKGQSGKFSVDYNNYFGFQSVTVVPKYLDAVNYALLRNERDLNANGPTAPIRYTDENIQAIRDGSMPDQYANTNWAEVALRDAPIQNHYLSFSGGSERTTYRASVGYLQQDAVVNGKFKNDRYTIGLNLNSKVANWLSFSNVTKAFWSKFKGPSGGANAITGETGIINQFQRSAPTVPVRYTNGEFGIVDGAYQNVNFSYPVNNVLKTGTFGNYQNDQINISERLGLTATLYKGLTFETSGSAVLDFRNISNFTPTNTSYDWKDEIISENTLNSLSNEFNFNYRLLNENILRYNFNLNEDNVFNVMAGHSVIFDRTDGFRGSLSGFPSDAIEEFNGGGVVNPAVEGGASEETWQSFFGRVNFSHKDKYLLEMNVRRDGSSKFSQQHRYGTFPSVSAGWNISQEDFLASSNIFSGLKIRASWGLSGNDRIGNYIYEQTYNTGLDYTLGNGIIVPAVALTGLANPSITWETIEQYDIGLDAALLNNKLFLNVDYFKRVSRDILYKNFPIPTSIGVSNLAAQNAAGMENSGVELALNYRESFGSLKVNVGTNVTWMADNKVTDLGPGGEETISGDDIIRIGEPFRAYYGYRMIGIFQTIGEVDNAPVQFGSAATAPGDIRYEDVSGPEGVPDGLIDAADRVVIGNPYPKWIYNLNANLAYAGFDFSAVFQGLGRVDRVLNGNGQQPMPDNRNNALSYWIDRWTPENPSTNLPRLGGVNNTVVSSFYVQDASYLRLRNLEIGYSLPVSLPKRISARKLRVFVSGQNLLTFTKFENFDPERATGGNTDRRVPLYKVYTAGLNLKF